jgi:tol-pal system protein YbgF
LKTQTKLFTAALLIVIASGPAYPQNRDILQLQKDMIDVQQMVKQLQNTVDRDNGLIKSLMEKMADQVNTLTGSMQKISQTVDGLKTQDDASTRELRTVLTNMNSTVKELEESVASARTQINSIAREVTTLKTTSEPLAGPDDLWRTANVDYNVGNWDLAVSGLQEFLSKYPNDPRAAEAQLRIGDALYAQKKYDLAITQYDIVLQKYPESDTTKSALLKKGLAQAETKQPQATNTLNEVVKKFPGTSEANTASSKLKELQAAQRPRTPAAPR